MASNWQVNDGKEFKPVDEPRRVHEINIFVSKTFNIHIPILEYVEEEVYRQVFNALDGKVMLMAGFLGVSRRTVTGKIKKMGLRSSDEFKIKTQ